MTRPGRTRALRRGGAELRHEHASGTRSEHRVLRTVVAGPVTHRAPLRAREELRVPHDEGPVETTLRRVRDGDSGKPAPDRLLDLKHVLIGLLDHVRHDPRLGCGQERFQVALPDVTVVVAGVQAVQDQALGAGQARPGALPGSSS